MGRKLEDIQGLGSLRDCDMIISIIQYFKNKKMREEIKMREESHQKRLQEIFKVLGEESAEKLKLANNQKGNISGLDHTEVVVGRVVG